MLRLTWITVIRSQIARKQSAIALTRFLRAVGLGHNETQKIPLELRPERGAILPLRKRYDTYANYRPVRLSPEMKQFSPLKNKLLEEGVDFVIVRELVGGLYFGEKSQGVNCDGLRYVCETLEYDEAQIRRVVVAAFDLASGRRGRLHNIHKSNVLLSSELWNEVVQDIHQDYPNVEVVHACGCGRNRDVSRSLSI